MRIYSFIKRNDGVALIEFSIVLPFLLILFLGMIELSNYTLQNQKLDKVASSMADFVTQSQTISTSDLQAFGLAVPQIMKPYNFKGTVIFTSASNSPEAAGSCKERTCINWQYRILGNDASRLGNAISNIALPGNYTILPNQNIIIAEAFLHYEPILAISSNFIRAFKAQTLYKVAIFKPRQGSLTTLNK